MTRFDAIRVIARHLGEQAVVANIGVPCKELYAARDRPENFYMLGSYTQASPLGLGIASGTTRDVWVIDGDGSILGTGILPVIGARKPVNLTIFCLDNGAFGSTGNQLTPAYRDTDIELLAIAAGFRFTIKAQTDAELATAPVLHKVDTIAYQDVTWDIVAPPQNTLEKQADYAKRLPTIGEARIPPKCPKCGVELEEKKNLILGYSWKCVSCGFKKRSRDTFFIEAGRAEKIWRAKAATMAVDPVTDQAATPASAERQKSMDK
jgi:sulfopyruvate decarboxylase subunit beta